ncbi:MAG: cyclic nucleotide-binding domain-containing protein [Deltaproteobacteria bacterium]|nr:cyclic nucleotide-binding domain-containing protein [Deltaproteobacteria bacterium]
MTLRSLQLNSWQVLNILPGEAARIGFMAAFLFFLLAANNVIKIVRDSLFLSRFPITQLPYVYLLAALVAGAVISIYSRYTWRLSLSQVILGSHAFIISNAIIFWLLVDFYDLGWVLYAFYVWSAIVGLLVVAQFWTLANDLFTPREGKRLFGILTASGTLGGMVGGLGAHWAVGFIFGTKQLLWLIVALFAGAFGVVYLAVRERDRILGAGHREDAPLREIQARDASGVVGTLRSSRYLQLIGALILVSVIISTLIDYQFKAAAKEAYPSTDALARFFGSYYAWLSVVTIFAQVWLTGRLLTGLGLTSSLLLLPLTLLAGSIGLLVWPGLFAATGTRLAEASLRTSVNHSGVEILYLPIPGFIKKKVKVFLDVTVERLGDGTAALIILFYTVFLGGSEVRLLSYFSIGLILIWATVVFIVRGGYLEALRAGLAYRELSLEEAQIDYADRETVLALLTTLEEKEERFVLFGLDLAEKLDPKVVVPRLPRSLLRHSSPEVRARAIKLLAGRPDPATLEEITQMLQEENKEGWGEAISAACAIFKAGAMPVVRPYLESPDPLVKRRVLECLLRHGDAVTREAALNNFRKMVEESGVEGEKSRVEAARLAGEVYDREFSAHLSRLIREDPSYEVIHAAMAAAGKGKYPAVVPHIVFRLGSQATKAGARDALIEYGEIGVKGLRTALFDSRIPRDIRLNIPRTLCKIHSQSAMNALLGGLLEDDRSIRFKVILALEEMARRFSDLKVDREIIESAIMSDVMLYSQRFAIFFVLFGHRQEPLGNGGSLLSLALTDSMERVRERVIWLLSLIYPSKDIRGVWGALISGNAAKQAYAVELLDNLLAGDVKRYTFPLYSDALEPERFSLSLGLLGWANLDTNAALRMLLEQDDVWLSAATIWEVGRRGLGEFHDNIGRFLDSEHLILREAAQLVGRGSDLVTKEKTLSTIEKVVFLKSIDIFAHATVEQLGRIAGLTEEVRFEPNEPIFHEGEPVDAIYLLLKGKVTVEKNGQKVREMSEKQAFGTVAALDLGPAVHTVKAIDPVYALKLNAQDFHDILSLDFELAQAVFRALCQLIRELEGR